MPERRIVKANSHAVPLIMDIVESAAFLPGVDLLERRLSERLTSSSATGSSLGPCEYFLGFEDHFPFGFVGFAPLEDCGELIGPFLYRDCLGKGLGEYLLNQVCEIVRLQDLRLLFALISSDSQKAENFLIRNGFEHVSADAEFIKRWRDGLLADTVLEPGTLLFARIIDIDI